MPDALEILKSSRRIWLPENIPNQPPVLKEGIKNNLFWKYKTITILNSYSSAIHRRNFTIIQLRFQRDNSESEKTFQVWKPHLQPIDLCHFLE